MDIDTFKVEDFFPYYLTQEQKTGLADAFRQFSPDSNIYTDLFATEILQGDCWENVPYFDYNSSQTRKVKGVILSNSCDIDQDNKRDLPVNVTFAPLVSFDKYKAALENSQNLSRESIDQKLNAIKEQRITSLIFSLRRGFTARGLHCSIRQCVFATFKTFSPRKTRAQKLYSESAWSFPFCI